MCGILISNYKNQNFINALKAQSFRGPDKTQIVKYKNLNFGFNYLSITSKKKNYPQPYELKNLILLFNGEIYNFNELNKEIKKKNKGFTSDNDTKTLINHIYYFGIRKTLSKLRGMWSFSLLDKKKNILYISRDRLGIKPLFFFKKEKFFIFSSSIKSIKKLTKNSKFNQNYLRAYLVNGTLDNSIKTPFRNIYNFPKSSLLKIDLNEEHKKFKFEKFWILKSNELFGLSKIPHFKKLLKDTLDKHCKLQKRVKSVVPLSSGLDSSILHLKRKNNNNTSISLSGKFFNEEVDVIKKFIKTKSNNHLFLKIKKEDFSIKNIKKFINLLDQPLRSLNPYFQYLIRKKAKKLGARVIYNGDGGDEVFGGYMYALPYVLKSLNIDSKKNLDNKSKKFLKDFSKDLFLENIKPQKTILTLKKYLIKRLLDTHVPYWLRVDDEISMLNSLENRVPYLDHKLIEFCMNFKTEFFYKEGKNKYFFRKSIEDKLPSYILNQKKIGKPGSSYILTYSVLKKEILKIIDKKFLNVYLKMNEKNIKLKFLKDVKMRNFNNADLWFRTFFLYNWIK